MFTTGTSAVTAEGLASQVTTVPTDRLLPADSPRVVGENYEHARLLAESELPLPPIIVHRSSMRVIDGMHRLRAAHLRGRREIDVLFFDGDLRDAFVLAVRTNITHGLPLSLADRTAAAERILASHPQWSDRRVASVTGLAPSTVAGVRRRSTARCAHSNTRLGNDGRVRPLNSASGRLLASEYIARRPDASVRDIADAAGISVSTAQDVRKRLRAGDHPVPAAMRDGATAPPGPSPRANPEPAQPEAPAKSGYALEQLKSDPSLRFTDDGRTLLRLLAVWAAGTAQWDSLAGSVPPHCRVLVAELAREISDSWRRFADRL